MSKKRLIEIKEWQEKENARLEAERLQKVREEEEWRNSKHIQQLMHQADIYEDYNYIVDKLEDEH